MIVVVPQYRMNVFGFYMNEALLTENNTNMGFHDQLAALQWVHDNIEAFGGDPNKVTIDGQSSGASSVAFHLVWEASWPFYQRAIVQSTDMGNFKPAEQLSSAMGQ